MRVLQGIAMAILLWPLAAHAGGSCRADSSDRIAPLIELYTSEGCDSCPAADRWLSTHFPAGTRTDGIPLAFHVDYWDRLGWKDRFAAPKYTARQYQAMRANRATFVYTPQLVLQGRDYTGWRRGSPAGEIAAASARAARARIGVQATVEAASLFVEAETKLDSPPRRETLLALAYVDSRLTSDVRAGENRGTVLTHDHVVRMFETRPLTAATASFSVRLPRPTEAGRHPTLVAFVQEAASGEILQALAVPLDDCR